MILKEYFCFISLIKPKIQIPSPSLRKNYMFILQKSTVNNNTVNVLVLVKSYRILVNKRKKDNSSSSPFKINK